MRNGEFLCPCGSLAGDLECLGMGTGISVPEQISI